MPYACIRCNGPIETVRISYRSGDTLFVGVPTRVCVTPKCVEGLGGEMFAHRQINRPPSETQMQQTVKVTEDTVTEYDALRAIYDDWVRAGKPGYFSEWVGAIEDVPDAS